MTTRVRQVCTTLATGLHVLYRKTNGSDHRLLNGYILKINQLHDLDSIIYHASRCLHELFNYRFFAFAMYDCEFNGGIDIWADPKTASTEVFCHIKNEFQPENLSCNIRSFESVPESGGEALNWCDLAGMHTFPVIDGPTQARLYLHARQSISGYHAELIGIIIKSLATAITNFLQLKKLENAAMLDPLTHCYNRRALSGQISHDLAHADRYATDLSIIMFDIDHFKQINDTYGHPAGDAVLRAIAKTVMGAIRKSDYLARYGGEEFVLVLPATKFSKAIEMAERLRQNIENMQVTVGEASISVTASFGVAVYKKGFNKNMLLKRADQMLYEAKRQGRNRIQPDLRVYYSPTAGSGREKPLLH